MNRTRSAVLTGVAWLLAAALTVYASSKLFHYQFVLLESVGEYRLRELAPMELMWAFFGHSPRYGLFLGACELVACVLLLHRRTRTLGALLAAGMLANIVFLDIEYEVYGPLGIAVVQLLLALILVAADWRSVVGAVRALVVAGGGRSRLVSAIVTVAWLGWLLFLCSSVLARRASNQYELRGGWSLQSYTVGGEPVALTAGDKIHEPMVWFEFGTERRKATVVALGGRETQGIVAFEAGGERMRWTMDSAASRSGDPSSVFDAEVRLAGDRLVLIGQRDGREVRMEMQRRPRWRAIEPR